LSSKEIKELSMKAMTVGQLKRNFASALDSVREGESIIVEYGRSHREVAVLIPFADYADKASERPLGVLRNRGSVTIGSDFSISDEELTES
jgi:prevent-host-death family protein